MKFRNNWKNHKLDWKTFTFRLKVSIINVLSIEIDPQRNFYGLTILNFTFKNR